MVCFELFVRTAIRRRRGITPVSPTLVHAVLTKDHVSTDSRPTFFPASLTLAADGFQTAPLPWKGSFDLQSTAEATGLIRFHEPRAFAAGETVPVLPVGRGVAGD
jgi:molybdopterin molybdotransferase